MVVVRRAVVALLLRELRRVLAPERQTDGLEDMTTRGEAHDQQQREHDPDPPQWRSGKARQSPVRDHRH
jgi:hypothetical protein